jgi:hypothetical protein
VLSEDIGDDDGDRPLDVVVDGLRELEGQGGDRSTEVSE